MNTRGSMAITEVKNTQCCNTYKYDGQREHCIDSSVVGIFFFIWLDAHQQVRMIVPKIKNIALSVQVNTVKRTTL